MKASLRRSMSALDELFAFVDRFGEINSLGSDVLFAVRLAAEELFANLIRHNSGGGAGIDVSLERDNDQLILQLVDIDVDPVGVDSEQRVDVDLPLSERTPGGLGIHLVKGLVDRLTYEYDHRTLRVTVIKNLEDAHV